MNIGEFFTDLHGNQYKIIDYHVLGMIYPLFKDNREAILTQMVGNPLAIIIRGKDQLILYNYHHRVYIQYDLLFIQHNNKSDIRKGFKNETDTKGNGTNSNVSRIPQIKSRTKRNKKG